MELSNKSLALLLVAAVVVSLGGTLISLNRLESIQEQDPISVKVTGQATGSGITNLSIEGVAGCTVNSDVNFGSGGAGNFNISTSSANSGVGFNNCSNGFVNDTCKGMLLNNTGNVDINVTVSANNNASGFLGGTSVAISDYQFRMENGTYQGNEQGCADTLFNSTTNLSAWAGLVNMTQASTTVCKNFTPEDPSDMMTTEYNITLVDSTPTGAKESTVTFDCTQI